MPAAALHSAVCSLRIELVITAHPTEIMRRTLQIKYNAVADALAGLDRLDATPLERETLIETLRREITAAWETEEIRRGRPSPLDEVRSALAIFDQTLWNAVPEYLRSLDRLASLQPRLLFPGHWDPVTDAMAKIGEYRRHRLDREAQVLAEVRRGPGAAADLTRRVYGELDDKLMVAAEMTMRAHLRKLVDDGVVAERGEVYEARR